MILKEAWDRYIVKWNSQFNTQSKSAQAIIRIEACNIYREAVADFFEPNYSINWNAGEVTGVPFPIPWSELNGN